jgi:hypothetical protein
MVITGIIIAAVILLGFTRFGIRAAGASGGKKRVILRAGFLRINLLKRIEKRKAKVKPKKKKKTAGRSLASASKQLSGTVTPALRALRKAVRIDRMRLKLYIGGGNDPCAAALLSGRLNIVWGAVYPVLNETLRIKRHDVRIGADFDLDKTRWEGDFTASISLGRLLAVSAVIIRAYIKHSKRDNIQGKAV